MRPYALLLPVVVGCGGDKDETGDTAPPVTCDSLTATPLGETPVGEWPPGFAETMSAYTEVGGRYRVETTCGDGVFFAKLTPTAQEDLLVVTEPWPSSSLTCGCVGDPAHDDDAKYDIIGQLDGFEFFIEGFGAVGVDDQNVVGSGALFASSAPFDFRACGAQNVNPSLGSEYDQIRTVVRLEGGLLSGSIVLARNDGGTETCELTGWELEAPL